MLQALIDETDSHNVTPRVFIIGGYIATVEQWSRLTDAWQEVLDQKPTLRYFAFREAFPKSGKPTGEFRNLTLRERDSRVAQLRKIIEDNVHAEFTLGFFVKEYQEAFGWHRAAKNSLYGFALGTLLPELARRLESLEVPRQQVDLILDARKIDEPIIMETWYWLRDNIVPDPPDAFTNIFINTPQFRGKMDIIALQASDMLVGHNRAGNLAHLNNWEEFVLPGVTRQIRGFHLQPTAATLREEGKQQRERLAGRLR